MVTATDAAALLIYQTQNTYDYDLIQESTVTLIGCGHDRLITEST